MHMCCPVHVYMCDIHAFVCVPNWKRCSASLQIGPGGMELWQPHLHWPTLFANSLADTGLDKEVIYTLQ